VASPGPEDRGAADLVFHQRPLGWRLRKADVVLFVDLPGTDSEAFFDVLAGYFPAGDVRASVRWPMREEDLSSVANEVDGARLIRARVDYGFYRCLPRTPVYATILGDPVDRVVALYDRVRRTPDHPDHARVTSGRLSLREFVCEPAFAGEIVNGQARRIAGVAWRDPAALPDPVLLQTAQANLGEFAFFGMAGRLRESVCLLAYTFGWPLPRDLEVVAQPEAPRPGEVPADARAAIEARTGVDRALLRWAGEQFDQRLRLGLFDLLEQNSRGRERYMQVLGEYEELGRVHAGLERAWSWRTAERLKRWRRAVIPPGSRRDRLYQRVGTYVFARRAPAR
jgi:hypothetical protein